MAIEAVQIATNRNAGTGAEAINLYTTSTASNLTLGQLLSAVCLRAGAILEREGVVKMNAMGLGTAKIDDLSNAMEAIATESVNDWATLKTSLENKYGLRALPETLDSYDERMTALAAIKAELDKLTHTAQEDMIDLQTLVNRRDVAFTTATNLVKALQTSIGRTASNFR